MPRPEILQLGPYPDWDQTPLEAAFVMHRLHEAGDRAAFLAQVGPKVRGIAARGTHTVGRDLLDACPALEIVAVYGVGYDGVDMATCRARGIAVTHTPDVLTGDVADLGVAMMLAQWRGVARADRWVRDRLWRGPAPLQRRVHGARAGILGLGRIGVEVARRLEGFDMQIAYCDLAARSGAEAWQFVSDPAELARFADVLFVTLSASPATWHIVDADVLRALGPGGLLVNISRAATVDEEALLDALESGALGAAALDVFEGEPRIDPRFLALDNVLLQPHHASATVETRQAMGQLMRDNLAAHFAGRPLLTPVPEGD